MSSSRFARGENGGTAIVFRLLSSWARRVALPGVSSDYGFAAIEGLGMAGGRIAADAAQSHHGEKGFRGKPTVAALAREMLEQATHLLPGDVLAQRYEEVGVAEIAVIFRHLVLPDQ